MPRSRYIVEMDSHLASVLKNSGQINILGETSPAPRMPNKVDDAMLAMANAAGFDRKLWYHGTRRRFSEFRPSNGEGIDELGRGIYLADCANTAWWWGKPNGFILTCVIRQGKIFDIATARTPEGIKILHDAHSYYMERLYGPENGMNYDEFAAYCAERDIVPMLQRILPESGYVGAYNHASQIPGQIVVFRPEDVRILARNSSKNLP